MKSLKRILITVMTLAVLMTASVSVVTADATTDLKKLTVYGVDSAGKKTKLKLDFKSDKYTYDLTARPDVVKLSIKATPATSTSTVTGSEDAVNTKIDTGSNKTTITVKSASGATQVYTLNTKKLTKSEDATYKADDKKDDKVTGKKKGATVEVNGKEYKISNTFKKDDVPKGFKVTQASYNGKKYNAIKGETKDLTAFWLIGDDEGFYIYDKDQDKFYPMNNVKVKSRMYTIVEPKKQDSILKEYDTDNVKIGERKVKAWVYDNDKGIYLVYAMNWDGETSLYTYDKKEECMQRYSISRDAISTKEEANKAYDRMKKSHNDMTRKYNIFRYIIIGMGIIIVILIFLLIHQNLKNKERKIKRTRNNQPPIPGADEKTDESAETDEEFDEDDIDAPQKEDSDEDDIDAPQKEDLDEEVVEEAEKETESELAADVNDIMDADKIEETLVKEDNKKEKTHKKKRKIAKSEDIGYGDAPTLGSELESHEGFYGGEIQEEDEVLVDIKESDEPELAEPIEHLGNKSSISDTSEIDVNSISEPEDIRATLKSMLADTDDEDDDDDFEFIDID